MQWNRVAANGEEMCTIVCLSHSDSHTSSQTGPTSIFHQFCGTVLGHIEYFPDLVSTGGIYSVTFDAVSNLFAPKQFF